MPDHLNSSNENICMISLTQIHTHTLLSFSCFIKFSSVSPLSDYTDYSILLICHLISIFWAKEYVILYARTVPQPLNPVPNLLLIFRVSAETSLSPKAFADQTPLPTPNPNPPTPALDNLDWVLVTPLFSHLELSFLLTSQFVVSSSVFSAFLECKNGVYFIAVFR